MFLIEADVRLVFAVNFGFGTLEHEPAPGLHDLPGDPTCVVAG